MPALLIAGGRNSRARLHRHLLAPRSGLPGALVTGDPREVGPLSLGVISPDDSTPIRPITGRHSLLPSSFPRRPIGHHLAAGLPRREDDGLTTFHGRITDGAGSASSPVARTATAGDGRGPCTWPLTV